MAHQFGKEYWENHWGSSVVYGDSSLPVNPYLPAETGHLSASTALDVGCGTGTEVLWLAEKGWRVTGADISATALAQAAARAEASGLGGRIEWTEADLSRWEPGRTWDLVVTSYAHPDIGQLDFYQRIASWVTLGGSLLIVGHLPRSDRHHGQDHPESATATLEAITELFAEPDWLVDAGYENTRTVQAAGQPTPLHDVVLRARRAAVEPRRG